MSANFDWNPGEEPPPIKEHSEVKLDVFRSYLREYINRLNVYPARDKFKLDFVDGFCGGGIFRDNTKTISGTPLIMLEEAKDAARRLNEGRRKQLDFDCKFYFVDNKKAHTDYLKKTLRDRGYNPDDDQINIRTSTFEREADTIINEIKERQPRSGRAIFLLDQKGYSDVYLSTVRKILHHLPAAEIILMIAVGSMINFAMKNRTLVRAYAALGFPAAKTPAKVPAKVLEIIEERDKLGIALAQRILSRHLIDKTQARFYTPFFLLPEQSRRELWLVHLSKHPTARNVMIERHWEYKNRFQHYGHGDIGMMGFDPVFEAITRGETLPLFNFAQHDEEELQKQLMESLAREMQGLASEEPITVNAMRHALANETAARFSDLDKVAIRLRQEKEVRILDGEGKPIRPRALLKPTDQIALPENLTLFDLSRRK